MRTMKIRVATLYLLTLLTAWSCCTDMKCSCPEPTITIYMYETEYTSIVRLTRDYDVIDSVGENNFHYDDLAGRYFEINKENDAFAFAANDLISDFNYILKNSKTHEQDTISDISYTTVPYSFNCNNCVLMSDEYHCLEIRDTKLRFNNEVLESFTISIK